MTKKKGPSLDPDFKFSYTGLKISISKASLLNIYKRIVMKFYHIYGFLMGRGL